MGAALDGAKAFECGWDLEARLDLSPRHNSSGGTWRLRIITVRGNCFLRPLRVHWPWDARARDPLDALAAYTRRMATSEPERRVVVVALTARLAGIARFPPSWQ